MASPSLSQHTHTHTSGGGAERELELADGGGNRFQPDPDTAKNSELLTLARHKNSCDMGRSKQYWSVAETICLLEIWSSSETKQQHKGATRTKEHYEQIQRELAAQGHDRAVEQIVNKIKKLKMEFKEQKYHSKQSRDYWVQKNPYFEVLECVFGNGGEHSIQLEDYFLLQSSTDNDMETWRESLSVRETDCLLKICAVAELHQRLDSSRTSKDIIEDIQKEMSTQGYDLTSEQILDKLTTLKREYRAQKNNPDEETGNCLWPKVDLDVVDFILGDTDECTLQTTETVKTEPTEEVTLLNTSANTGLPSSRSDPVLPAAHDLDAVKMEPMENNTPLQLPIDPALCSSDLKMACAASEALDCSSYPSRPPLRSVQKMNSEKWIDAEVQALLSVYAATKMQRDSEGHKTNNKIFDSISKELANFGVYHTAKQCREKVKKLKQDYKKIKDYNNQSGAEIKTGKWYDVLDSILGHHPFYSGAAAAHMSENSAEELMESTRIENNTHSREGLESICTENNVESRENPKGPQVSETMHDPDRKAVLQLSIDAALCSSDLKIVHVVPDTQDCSSFSSLPLPRPLLKMNNDKWIDAEVQGLLSVYAATKMQGDFEGQKKNKKIFDSISKELENFGIHHTPKQCREKVKKLKQDYKKIKDYNNQSGAEIKTGKWYDILDSILGHHPFYSGAAAAHMSENSAEELMESTRIENNTHSREGLESICTENNVESRESSEESALEPEKRLGQFPCTEQHRVAGCNSFLPAVRSLAFRSRPVKRKRKESSELVECLERMEERYLQHSREMHEALLNNMDTHMSAVIGLMERIAAAMEAQVAKPTPPH